MIEDDAGGVMKIVVPIKQVAALDDDFELLDDGLGVDPDFLEFDLNEWDQFSLEAGLQLREAGGGEVVAVTVGDEEAEEGLLSALAKGADRAVRVWDDGLVGADPLAVARVLAAAIEPESPDLVLCGVQSSDAVNSATGVALAGFLGLAHVAVVKGLELDGGTAVVDRELEGGLVELVRIGLPALLTIQTGINEPRYATLRAIKQAREKPLGVLSLADVGLDAAALEAAAGSRRRRLVHPEAGARAEMLEGSSAEVAARIVSIVRERTS
jgi:electron transfer flavoprotein beta subunit